MHTVSFRAVCELSPREQRKYLSETETARRVSNHRKANSLHRGTGLMLSTEPGSTHFENPNLGPLGQLPTKRFPLDGGGEALVERAKEPCPRVGGKHRSVDRFLSTFAFSSGSSAAKVIRNLARAAYVARAVDA